jgi:Protein of unknown function, DUF547
MVRYLLRCILDEGTLFLRKAIVTIMIAVLLAANFSLAAGAKAATDFHHEAFDSLLAKYVNDRGWVDYPGLARDRASLDAYLKQLATADPASFGNDSDRLAFWINAYNATTLAKALDQVYGKVKGVKDVSGFFTSAPQRIAGEQLTLDQIETRARHFADPRVHFAVVCASTSCPKLQPFAFTGAQLNDQLDRAAHEFLADPSRGLRLDQEHKKVYLSSIFKWYAGDFTGASGSVASLLARAKAATSGREILTFIKKYAPADAVRFIDQNNPSVEYADYDWTVNAQDTHR